MTTASHILAEIERQASLNVEVEQAVAEDFPSEDEREVKGLIIIFTSRVSG